MRISNSMTSAPLISKKAKACHLVDCTLDHKYIYKSFVILKGARVQSSRMQSWKSARVQECKSKVDGIKIGRF
jgi:hypothetical protein